MKKAILVIAVLVVAVFALTSFNDKTEEKKSDDKLIASVTQKTPVADPPRRKRPD
jgi:hypothetical protein